MRPLPALIGVAMLTLALSGCGDNSTNAEPTPPGTPEELAVPVVFGGEFAPYEDARESIAYDQAAVPEGASTEITVEPVDGGTRFQLSVSGLEAGRQFGAHLHTQPCGPDPDDAGPHYQDEADPQQPSTDPEYANPENEIWLDFATDADGDGSATTTVDWRPRPGEADSVVIHQMHTRTGAGEAGTAGDRLACVNVPL